MYKDQVPPISLHNSLLNPLHSFHSHCHRHEANIYYFNFFIQYFSKHAPNRFSPPSKQYTWLPTILVCLPEQNLTISQSRPISLVSCHSCFLFWRLLFQKSTHSVFFKFMSGIWSRKHIIAGTQNIFLNTD